MPQPTPPQPPQRQGDGGGWTTARLALLGAFVLVALLLGLFVGNQLGSSDSKGNTTVVSKNPHTTTVTTATTTTEPTTLTETQTETTTVTTTVTTGGG